MSSAPASPESSSGTHDKRVLIVAGEPSGDMHAAGLISELKALEPGLRVDAMGGNALRDAGAQIIVDNRGLAVVGLVEVLRHYPVIRRALKQLETQLEAGRPDLLILVDYVEFNLKLAKTAKQLGIKVLFYISPQVWAWRPKRVHKIGKRIDMMAVIFPFEVPFYEQHGIPVRYVGNPLVGRVKADKPRDACMEAFGLDPSLPVVGLQPGSRRSEVSRLTPTMGAAAQALRARSPDVQFVLPVAPGLNHEMIRGMLPDGLDIRLIENESPYNVMQVCDAIVTASGTATLQTALMRIPMVITYKVQPLSYAIFRRLITIPNIGLVNIVAGKPIVRELIQHAATPEAIATEVSRLLEDKNYRNQILADYEIVSDKLGSSQGSSAIAGLAFEMLKKSLINS
ncbi:MAG: lipid-A-disaccharide synthase [Thiotrichales bacterium]